VVVCGKLRTVPNFLSMLQMYRSLRDRGCVRHIVFSTWIGELESKPEIREVLTQAGVIVIENEEPLFASHGNYFPQVRALQSALDILPDDVWVFKTRTDLAFRDEEAVKGLLNVDLSLRKRAPHSSFEHRIWVAWAALWEPFFINETVYFGQIRDLRRLCNFDYSWDICDQTGYRGKQISAVRPETRLFLPAFVREFPVFEEYKRLLLISSYYQWNNKPPFAKVLTHLLSEDIYWDYLAAYFRVLDLYFKIGLDGYKGDYHLAREVQGELAHHDHYRNHDWVKNIRFKTDPPQGITEADPFNDSLWFRQLIRSPRWNFLGLPIWGKKKVHPRFQQRLRFCLRKNHPYVKSQERMNEFAEFRERLDAVSKSLEL